MIKETTVSRRGFVGGAAALATALAAEGISVLIASPGLADDGASAEGGVQYAFWVDTKKCDGCGACVDACREHNQTPVDAEARRMIREYTDAFGNQRFVTTSCMHCAVPSCAEVCPAKAITKREDGIVVVDEKRCIGCRYCYTACPFAVPSYTSKGMDKCDCCLGNGVAAGDAPHCVQACETGALNYGTVDELVARSGKRAQPIDGPTGPSYFLS